MGYLMALFAFVAVVFLALGAEAGPFGSSRCPPPSKVYYTKPICRQDYDCKHGMVCCPNQAHTKSCAYPAPYSGGNHRQTGGPGVYCDGVKCSPFEVCKLDPLTKRLRCQRA